MNCQNLNAILKMETGRNFSMSGINSGRWNRTMLNLCGIVVAILKMETGRNFKFNIVRFQRHFMWVDYDVPKWFLTSKNFYRSPFSKWPPQYRTNNFSMLGINSGHHYLPTYQILMISGNVEFLPPIFYTVFWQPFWKWQTSGKFWKRRILLSFRGPWTCPRQISGTTRQNFKKLGGVIDISF
jgi:hypothetical protein